MSILRWSVTSLALLGTGALFGAAIFDAVVLAPNLRGGATVLEHGRQFLAAANPGDLFRILAPATQVALLVAVIVHWPAPARRWPLLVALLVLVASDVITFTYHYPRNALLFTAPLTIEPERLAAAARQWTAANLVRVVLVLGSWTATLVAFARLAQGRSAG
jgi:uncharacterized membrane protein